MIAAFRALYRTCREAHTATIPALLLFYWRKQYGVNLLAQPNTQIVGIRNLRTGTGILNVGVSYVGFAVAQDVARLNISGKLHTEGDVRIGKGCRLDIGPQATVHIGEGTYLNPYTRIVSLHGLRIGKYCAISWECQFLDEDFHAITYETPRPAKDPRITVGDHVWIGSRVSVFKGATIPTGCVVASGAVVTKAFTEENCLLAGNPAEVVRRNITWE